MKNQNKKQQEQNSVQKQENKVTFKQRFLRLTIKNPFVVILSLALIILFIWFSVKISSERNAFQKTKNELVTRYEYQLDSIHIKNIEFVTTVFSWSVRSEMLRGNIDNLNQLFNVFIKDSGASLIQLINAEDNTILISSDKKFEGGKFNIPSDINLNGPTTVTGSSKVIVYTPVMGFNERIGLLMVESSRR